MVDRDRHVKLVTWNTQCGNQALPLRKPLGMISYLPVVLQIPVPHETVS